MSAAPPAAVSSANLTRGSRNRYRSRRGQHQTEPLRGGHNPTSDAGRDVSLTLRPVLETPARERGSVHEPADSGSRSNNARGRGWRHNRTRRGGTSGRTVTAGSRTFGGQLTSAGSSPAASLQPDAPEFRPGQPLPSRNSTSSNHPLPILRRILKSSAPDLATRTHDDIANGLYECAICTAEVLRNSKVWSCKTCWTVFHLSCIKRWSGNEGSTQQQEQAREGEMPPARQWRCPGCNLPKDDLPTSYTCWCTKEVDPKSIHGLPPHSCGQTCSKPRAGGKCPHPCELLCHAGPCLPCPHTGPVQACFCGKETISKRCIDTDYDHGWSCGSLCGDLMPCGEHTCGRGCHEGLCGSCEVLVESRCYCGKILKQLLCCNRGEQMESTGSDGEGGVSSWTGSFDCGNICKRLFDCDKHSCEKPCHAQDLEASHCPLSTDVVSHCPCGKTSLEELDCHRVSCEDPIPRCHLVCERPLSCGHSCQQQCHSGECRPCLQASTIKCRCGRTTSTTVCHQGVDEPPQCARACKALLNCGRHECAERCCPAEKIASKRKMKASRAVSEYVEAEHICTRTCGRQLKCGNLEHECQKLCHRGPCGSCPEAIFDEIACHCGRTVLHPPLPCGTQPPSCLHQCNRQKECGHPQTMHQCHTGESCPKCPYLVERTCMCGKSKLKNQTCGSSNISCGQACGRRLRCGIHYCRKPCHRPSECEDAGTACPHRCGQKKTAPGCAHPCLELCHAPYPCKEDKPCQAKAIITCVCQHQKQEIKCMATKNKDGNESRVLPCDDECLRLQRNQKLAFALNISSDHTNDYIPYTSTTLDMFKDNVKWCQLQEREFRLFAADASVKRLRFRPMPSHHRAFIHSLAEDFGLDSESMDPEPHRHVSIFKTPRFVSAPMKTLSQCLKVQPKAQPTAAKTTMQPIEQYNALILTSPRFALTIDELRSHLRNDLATVSTIPFNISFLPSEESVIYPDLGHISEVAESVLIRLKPIVAKTVAENTLAKRVMLCRVDNSLNVTRREQNDRDSSDGWSQVVKGSTASKARGPMIVGGKSSFTVLGSKIGADGWLKRENEKEERKREERKREREVERKKEKDRERDRLELERDVVDDWEDAVDEGDDRKEGKEGREMVKVIHEEVM